MLAASKQIEANLSAYNGGFTVRLFGEVMAAYCEFRRPLYAEMLKEIDAQKRSLEEAEKQSRNAMARDAIVERFKAMKSGSEAMFNSIDSIPDIWAKVLVEEMLVFGNASTWIEAKKKVVERFMAAQSILMADETLSQFDARRVYLSLKNEPDIFPEELKPRATILYGRMLVWNELNNFEK